MLAAYQLAAIQAGPTNGTLKVAIKDAPVDLSQLEVTIDSLEVQSQDNGWINIPFIDAVQSVTFNLLSLQDVTKDLSTTQIPTGTYTKMRLHVSEATATYNDATTENLNVPSDKIDVIIHFEVTDETTTSILRHQQHPQPKTHLEGNTTSICNAHSISEPINTQRKPNLNPKKNTKRSQSKNSSKRQQFLQDLFF